MSTIPWEPPFAGTEAEHIIAALERQRTTFRWKADGLDRAGLNVRIGASALTIGGLLKHLALVEDDVFAVRLSGDSIGEPWMSTYGGPGWDFTSAVDDSPEDLYAIWDGAVRRSRRRLAAALESGSLTQLVDMAGPDGVQANLARLLCDLLEEYGRHVGHADLLREAVDGRVGEDPPWDWRPGGAAG